MPAVWARSRRTQAPDPVVPGSCLGAFTRALPPRQSEAGCTASGDMKRAGGSRGHASVARLAFHDVPCCEMLDGVLNIVAIGAFDCRARHVRLSVVPRHLHTCRTSRNHRLVAHPARWSAMVLHLSHLSHLSFLSDMSPSGACSLVPRNRPENR